ncbi:transcriptional regulator [Thiohalorhabdus methylotrophus]|uniref:Transcriptional regulator n=1 Tax=Thiohalorhabdus methylotrophus TaxID=3242694 RepID=A0ABV4TYY9_9GAMM
MRFSVLVAVVPEADEDKALASAKEAGAGSVTVLKGRGQGLEEQKTFFGLTYEGAESVLLFVLERRLSVRVLKNLHTDLDLQHSDGYAFSFPVEHLAGINFKELSHFEESVKEEL